MQQLEQEIKLEVGPGWSLPDLTGLFPGVRAVPLPTLTLDAVYYDTAGSRLAQHHITLRVRREVPADGTGADDGAAAGTWTVKLPSAVPSDGTVLVRTEVTWPAAPAPGGGATSAAGARPRPGRRRPVSPPYLPPHPEAARFLQAVTLGAPLVPVAQLTTVRQRTDLRTSDSRSLAEVDHDSVTGRALAPTANGTGRGAGPVVAGDDIHFIEVEVELTDGSSQEVLRAVVHRLRLAGAKPSSHRSKVATVLGMAALAAPAGPASAGPEGSGVSPGAALNGHGAPGQPGGGTRRAHALMSGALAEQARECLDALVDHDPAIRLSDPDPEHVHQARVGARRLRSVLRSFAPLVATAAGEADDRPETWFAELRDELKWLGGALGAVRDADVRLQGLVEECSTLAPADNLGATALLAAAEDDQHGAHEALLEAMDGERYVGLLRSLEALASGPGPRAAQVPEGLWARLAEPASAGLPALAHRQWRAVRKQVRGLGDEPADTALHQVRIQAKRLRYLSDVAALFVAPAARRAEAKATSKAAARLQDVLGELHDATVTEQWLRDASTRVTARTKPSVAFASGLAAGALVVRAQDRQRALRKKWPAAWAPLQSPKLHQWTAP